MVNNALLIGNSSGIGLAATEELLKRGWRVTGVSRSSSTVRDDNYSHFVADVGSDEYLVTLESVLGANEYFDLCIYCAGIGELLDINDMKVDVRTVEVNLLGLVKTASLVIPKMVHKGEGHFIGFSSVADELLSSESPAYHASKAGLSNYLEGLALAVRQTGIYVTNLRFGFVNTKMAKGDVKPFMMSVDRAVEHLFVCMKRKPVRYTAPRIVIPLVKFRKFMMRLGIMLMKR